MSHDIVIFQTMFLGNVFGKFPKSKVPETLDFPTSPDSFPEINKMGSLKIFLGKWENVFLGESTPNILFLGNTILGKIAVKIQEVLMRKIGYKGRCEKKSLSKCKEVCRTYDPIQSKYAELLDGLPEIEEIRCNVPLEGFKEGNYMTDFVCVKSGGDLMVRECVWRNRITKPLNVKLLDASREYWTNRGVKDWGMVTNEEE